MALNLAAVLSESARRFPDRVAVRSGDERITYRDLWDQARRYAGALRDAGVSAGDRVAILLPNTPDFPRVYFAIQTLGAIGVPVHALLRAEEIRYVLEDSEAKALIAGAALITEGARGAALAGVPCYALGASDVADATDFGLAAESAEPITRSVDRAPGDDAMILYTSGTTGSPKGAVLTHLNVVVNSMLAEYPVLDLRSQDVILACLPLFHTFGQNCVMNAGFRAGATLVLMPRFAADAALELMVTEQVTVFMGVPTMYIGLLDAAKRNLDRPPPAEGDLRAAPRCRLRSSRISNRSSQSRSSKATGCPKRRPSRRSTTRSSDANRARSVTRFGVSKWKLRNRRSLIGSSSCPPMRSARSLSAATTS